MLWNKLVGSVVKVEDNETSKEFIRGDARAAALDDLSRLQLCCKVHVCFVA